LKNASVAHLESIWFKKIHDKKHLPNYFSLYPGYMTVENK
jgi:hypothetical protein